MNQRVMFYFDMDGVIADWVSAYNANAPMPLSDFELLSREERAVLKEDLFNREFFANMPALDRGMRLLLEFIDRGHDVMILSASGRVNREEVIQGKIEMLYRHIPSHIEARFVDKVEMKSQEMVEGYDVHVLIDDRQQSIDAWVAAGGVGYLFE